jgi:iron complex outermembrane receptor protein
MSDAPGFLSGYAFYDLRASASRAFRLPSFTDLYYSDLSNQGNPNLKPESATSYEVGADAYFRPGLRAAVTVFQRRDTNVIDYVRANEDAVWQATNFDRLHFTGVEASTIWEPAAGQRISLGFTALRGADISAAEVEMSKYTFYYPIHSGVVEWRGMVSHYVVARTRIGVVDRLSTSPYAVWDASAAWAQGWVRPFVQLTNISNTVYEEIQGRAAAEARRAGWRAVRFQEVSA